MRHDIVFAIAFLAAILSQTLFGGAQSPPQETIVLQPREEYQLRILESQIQMLRHKLYAQQKMDDEAQQQWLDHYNEVAKRLQSWNRFAGRYGLRD